MKKKNIRKGIYVLGLGTIGIYSIFSLKSTDVLGKPLSIEEIQNNDYMDMDSEVERLLYKLNYSRQCSLHLQRHNQKKQEVLNNYKKCETLDDIFKRQEELESLNLSDEDKIYENCSISASLQHFIYEQSIMHNLPFDYLLSIAHAETRGLFNASGLSSYNPDSNTYDLGYTQQNSKASLPVFCKKYNVDYNTGWNLVLNNDYANVCAAFLVIDEINKVHTEYDPYEYAGCYNGWLEWKNYSISQDYVYNHFSKAYDEVFTEHHFIETEKQVANNKQLKYEVAHK